jgi:tetratricopeptide (TPR) repeat protein
MKSQILRSIAITAVGILVAIPAYSQSSRPRRVAKPAPSTTQTDSQKAGSDPLLDVTPTNGSRTTTNNRRSTTPDSTSSEPLLSPVSSPTGTRSNRGTTTSNTASRTTAPAEAQTRPASSGDTTHAYQLLQQKLYDQAAKEAGAISERDPNNSEAWKILGFARLNLKQNAEAADALQRAVDIQKREKQEDPNTADALALAYARNENYERAFPLLTTATERPGAKVDPVMLYYKGVAAYNLKKPVDAEKAFNEAVKADPKDTASLFYLGRIALEKNDLNGAITALNRVTAADPKSAAAWSLLMRSYMQRAALNQDDPQKAAADFQGAVRAGEGLTKVKNDVDSATIFAQALIQTEQYARAAMVLDRFAADPKASGPTLYLLGLSHSRAKNYPKAIVALEKAATKTPNDPNIFKELGYDYEVSKQYAKALSAYQRGEKAAPDDAFFKEGIARVTPYAQ